MAIVSAMERGDPRARLAALIDADTASYAALSRMLRRNDAYLQQYVRRGTPRDLAERDRALLAAYFRVDAAELGGPPSTPMATIRRLDVEVSAGPGAIANDDPGEADMLLDPACSTICGCARPVRRCCGRVGIRWCQRLPMAIRS